MFHVLGVDILLDEQCEPHLMEINAHPSMNIMFEEKTQIEVDGIVNFFFSFR